MNRKDGLYWVFTLLGALMLLFIIAPLTGMFLKSSGADLVETARDVQVQGSIWLTLGTSFMATFVFGLLAIPLAYLLARRDFRGKQIILAVIDLPIVIPHSAAGIAILGFISRDSALGSLAASLGINLVGNPLGISIAMAFVSIPFLINAARDGFSAVPVRLEKVAMDLGASPMRTFFTVSVPLAWRHIVSGLILMFARGMSEFGAVVIVAYHPMITPVLIYERFGAFGLKYARPAAALFVAVCLVFFVALRLLSSRLYQNKSSRA
jgi:molybdate/tungstate transport system permease protein